jgi:hypothetical protein
MQSTGLVIFGIFIIFMEIIMLLIGGINSIFLHLSSNTLLIIQTMNQYYAYVFAFAFASIFAGAFNIRYYLIFIIAFELLAFLFSVGVI